MVLLAFSDRSILPEQFRLRPDKEMEKQVPNLSLRVPADCIGEVLGELNSRLGLILEMKHNDDVFTVEANLPNEEIPSYVEWFSKFTNGKGEIIAH
jgi:translation elongation factor EF-G